MIEHLPLKLSNEYAPLLAEVKSCFRAVRLTALRAVNIALVSLYWDIGRVG